MTMAMKVKCNDGAELTVHKTVTGNVAGDRAGWGGPVRDAESRTETGVLKSIAANHGGIKSPTGSLSSHDVAAPTAWGRLSFLRLCGQNGAVLAAGLDRLVGGMCCRTDPFETPLKHELVEVVRR